MINKVLNNQLLTENGNVYMELSKERGVTRPAESTLAGVSMSKRLTRHSFARGNSDCSCADCLGASKKGRKGGPIRRSGASYLPANNHSSSSKAPPLPRKEGWYVA